MRYEEFVNIQLGKLKKAGLVDPDKIPDMDLYINPSIKFINVLD